MEINRFRLSHLRNGEHYKYHFNFAQLVAKYRADALGVTTLYAAYEQMLAREFMVYEVIRKSDYTESLADGDVARDTFFGGLVGSARALCNHFDPALCAAAQHLCKLFDQHGNVAVLSYEAETAALMKIIDELRGAFAADVKALGLESWVNALDTQNKAFDALMAQRNATGSQKKPDTNMKQERLEVDDAYRAIVKRINALAEVNGASAYEPFIREVNGFIDQYSLALAQRQGRIAADATETTPPAPPVMR